MHEVFLCNPLLRITLWRDVRQNVGNLEETQEWLCRHARQSRESTITREIPREYFRLSWMMTVSSCTTALSRDFRRITLSWFATHPRIEESHCKRPRTDFHGIVSMVMVLRIAWKWVDSLFWSVNRGVRGVSSAFSPFLGGAKDAATARGCSKRKMR